MPDLEPANTVEGESLIDFLDHALSAEENQTPAVDAVVEQILERAYVATNGWSGVEVTDNLGREFTLSAPTIEGLAAAVQRFYNLR